MWACESGKAGLKLLAAHPVDLVITDVVMPDQDGLEIVMHLRKTHPHLPILLMSGDAPRHAAHYLEVGEKLGATRTLLKPFSIRTLLDTVTEVLGARRAIPDIAT